MTSKNPAPILDWFFSIYDPEYAKKKSKDKKYTDLQVNQSLSIILNDDDLRSKLIEKFKSGKVDLVQPFPSAYHPDDLVRSRPISYASPARHRQNTWLVAGYEELREVLSDKNKSSNVPYADLGDRSFLLALDSINGEENSDAEQLYLRQRNYLNRLIQDPAGQSLSQLVNEATRHALVAGLTRNRFDLAIIAEQAAIRFCGLWFGYASTDHSLIESASKASYAALVHLILGRHFLLEPTVIPKARAAMSELTERTSALIAEYREVKWKPREIHGNLKNRKDRADWPEGVTPLDQWGLSGIGQPLLQKMALNEDNDFSIAELASMAIGLIVGTVGNVQASVCIAMDQIFTEQRDYLSDEDNKTKTTGPLDSAINKANETPHEPHTGSLYKLIGQLLINQPPVAFLPRRALKEITLGNATIKKGDDIILWLTAASELKRNSITEQLKYKDGYYGLPFGATDARIADVHSSQTPHSCIGKPAAHALVTAIVGNVLRLPSIAEVIDPVSNKVEGLTKRWGFSCQSYPMTHKRAMRLAQQPLNVIMRVKTPTDVHSAALKHIIHVGAPRVEKVLRDSGHVHFAWFQLLEQGQYLALHTVYDGDFDAYIQDFALKVDDLFDLLFEHVESAPKLPVAENPGSFVEVIRANNIPSVNGFFFSAFPTSEVTDIIKNGRW